MPTLSDLGQSLMAKVACRKTMYKVNGLLGKKEEDEDEEERKTRAMSVHNRTQGFSAFMLFKASIGKKEFGIYNVPSAIYGQKYVKLNKTTKIA